jgi:hypothetical protein
VLLRVNVHCLNYVGGFAGGDDVFDDRLLGDSVFVMHEPHRHTSAEEGLCEMFIVGESPNPGLIGFQEWEHWFLKAGVDGLIEVTVHMKLEKGALQFSDTRNGIAPRQGESLEVTKGRACTLVVFGILQMLALELTEVLPDLVE